MNQHDPNVLLLPHIFRIVETFFVFVPKDLSPKPVIKRFFFFLTLIVYNKGQHIQEFLREKTEWTNRSKIPGKTYLKMFN